MVLCDFSCDCSNSQRLGLGSVLEALYLLANVLLPSPHKVLPAAYGDSYLKPCGGTVDGASATVTDSVGSPAVAHGRWLRFGVEY